MKRVLIIGICGAGKSTLSHLVAKKYHLPLIHLDKEFWQKGWIETPKDEWRDRVEKLIKRKQWVMEGNFAGTLDLRIPAADTIIYLDFNRYIAIYRVLKRLLTYYGRTREDLPSGCPERFDLSFLKYIWNFHKTCRVRNEELLNLYGKNKTIIRLSNPKEVRAFIHHH